MVTPKKLIFGKQTFFVILFQNIPSNRKFYNFKFLRRHTLVLYNMNILQ